jgi:hypothetical protein
MGALAISEAGVFAGQKNSPQPLLLKRFGYLSMRNANLSSVYA